MVGSHMTRCGTINSVREVPAVSLETVISRWLGGRRVNYVKIDAQGMDLRVAESVGAAAPLVDGFRLEITGDGDKCALPLKGGVKCSETVAGMRALGFKTDTSCDHLGEKDRKTGRWRPTCGGDAEFVRESRGAWLRG